MEEDNEENVNQEQDDNQLHTEADFRQHAAKVYEAYAGPLKKRFRWLHSDRLLSQLAKDLRADIKSLLAVLKKCGDWNPDRDAKLDRLVNLIARTHPGEKIIIFTQFADTVHYLANQLEARGIGRVAAVTGDTEDPTKTAWRFSPETNDKRAQVLADQEIDILIATDVLSEGQNLQDAAIVVNYDLPWAIIRLIQRAGRVDRIGQKAETILCYSFLPADGVERIIRLRARVRQRLQENAEVVGTDETFFEDDRNDQPIRDLFTEKAGILGGDADTEVDLGSYALQIWKNAIDGDPSLQKIIPDLPNVMYSTKPHAPIEGKPEGVLVYVRTAEGHDALIWMDKNGNSITESQFAILKAAECEPDSPTLARHDNHHNLVRKGVELIATEEKSIGGQLGRPSGARFRTYELLRGERFNLDFHAIPHRGEAAVLEKHYVSKRSHRERSVLVFLVQDSDSHVLCYSNATVNKHGQAEEILRFVEFWQAQHGQLPPLLIFDSQLTTYRILDQLDERGIRFITLRRRGKALMRSLA